MRRVYLASLVLWVSAAANAEPPPAPAVPEATDPLWIGPQLDLMVSGSVDVEANGQTASGNLDTAFGLGGVLEYRVSPLVTVGFAPRFAVPVKVNQANTSGEQLDLRARITVGKEVAPRFRLHGIATLGYSWIFGMFSQQNQMTGANESISTSGIIGGLGAGTYYTINPHLLFVAELSYQYGRQGTTIQNVDVRASDTFVTFGFGLMTALQ